MIDQTDWRHVWIVMSALAGSITSLSFMKYKEMTWPDIVLTLFVGFAFAVIFVPWAAADWVGIPQDNLRAVCGVVYIGGTAWNILLPVAIRKIKQNFGGEEKA